MPIPARIVAVCFLLLAVFVLIGGIKAMFFAAYFLFLIPIFYLIFFFKADVRPPLPPRVIQEYHVHTHTHIHRPRTETCAQEISCERPDGTLVQIRSIKRLE